MADSSEQMPTTILVTGASGSGTTTLGAALASTLGGQHLDGDDYFWLPTLHPYTQRRAPSDRQAMMMSALATTSVSVISGCVIGWGRELEDALDLVVFLSVDTDVRIARLRERELRILGRVDEEFIAWAAQYEEGRLEGRSRARQEAWLRTRTCPVLRLEGAQSIETLIAVVVKGLGSLRD